MARRIWIAALLLALLAESTLARAELGPNGSSIQNSDYRIDLTQGPILATSRQTALAGTHVSLADGIEGFVFNPAALAVRMPYSTDDADYGLTGGATFAVSVRDNDFDNNGRRGFAYNNFVFLTGGAALQYKQCGLGINVDLQRYEIGLFGAQGQEERAAVMQLAKAHLGTACSFARDQVVVGTAVRAVGLLFDEPFFGRNLFANVGFGLEVGALYQPRDRSFRLGLTARTPVIGQPLGGAETTATLSGRGVYLPSKIELPWEIEAGFAFQLGPRPLNLSWVHTKMVPLAQIEAERRIVGGQRESDTVVARRILARRHEAIPRGKLLVAASLLVVGDVRNAVGFESFLAQEVDRSGEHVTLSPRVGIETEIIPSLLQLRGGSYAEPSRFRTTSARVHGTFGFDARVLHWTVFNLFPDDTWWRIGAFVDSSRDYLAWGLSAGLWR